MTASAVGAVVEMSLMPRQKLRQFARLALHAARQQVSPYGS
jgi:hypothetical protein